MIMHSRIPWLDICRSLAICLVLLSHGRTFLTTIAPWTAHLKFGGYLGVELFFVLSGYLIGHIIINAMEKSNYSGRWIPNFWLRRWLRTFPNYVLFLVINIVIATNIRPENIPNLLNYLTFTQSLTSPHPSFFGEAWSLVIEEVFYFLIPILLTVVYFFTRKLNLTIVMTALAITVSSIGARYFVVYTQDSTFNSIRGTALLHLDVLLVGVVIALFVKKADLAPALYMRIRRTSYCMLPLFFIAAIAASLPDKYLDNSILIRVIGFNLSAIGCASFLIVGLQFKINGRLEYISSRIARWSYAAYLTNLPIIYLLKYMFPTSSQFSSFILWITYIFLTFLSAYLVYRFFEKNFLSLRDKLEKVRMHHPSKTLEQ
jgi:peptidoglycan/LPS O-acetylase OafA/YrhL